MIKSVILADCCNYRGRSHKDNGFIQDKDKDVYVCYMISGYLTMDVKSFFLRSEGYMNLKVHRPF